LKDFKEIPHPELQLIMAKLFHHAWYDNSRGRFLLDILIDWEKTPCKEVKFLNEINNGTEQTELR
jgi:hypothetical protein